MQFWLQIILVIFVLIPSIYSALSLLEKVVRCFSSFRANGRLEQTPCEWIGDIIKFCTTVGAISATFHYMFLKCPRPEFYLNSLEIHTFHLTSDTILTTNTTLNISATNPNKDITFFYYPFSATITTAAIKLGNGSFPYFEHFPKNTSVLQVGISGIQQQLDEVSAEKLKMFMEDKDGLPLEVKLRSQVISEMDGMGGPETGVNVSCKGIRATIGTAAETVTAVLISDHKCKVDMDIIDSNGSHL